MIVSYFVYGLGQGWVAPAVEWLQSNETTIAVNADQLTWITSVGSVGDVISTLVAAFTVSRLGTKSLSILQTCLSFLSWSGVIMARNAETLMVSMLLNGLSSGICLFVLMVYFGEICSPSNRGIFMTFAILSEQFGDKLELISSEYISFRNFTRIPMAASVVAFVTSFFMKETPHQLLMRDKKDDAAVNYAWLSGKSVEENRAEMEELTRFIEEERRTQVRDMIKEAANYNSCLMAIVTFVVAHVHCGMVIRVYEIFILKPFADIMSGKTFLFVYGLLHMGLWFVNPFIIKLFSPRRLLVVGFLLTSAIQFVCAGLFYVVDVVDYKTNFISYAIFGTLYCFEVAHLLTIYPAVFTLQTELFPPRLKSGGVCATNMLRNVANFVFLKTFLIVANSIGVYWNFLTFACIHLAGLIYVYSVVPETKGKSLVEIRHEIKTKYENYASV